MEQPNISYIQNMSGGDKNFEKKLIGIIKSEFPIEMQVYFNSMKIKNFDDASEIVHKIKHKISILGLDESYKNAIAFEHGLREGDIALQVKFETTLMIITDFLKNFK
jgi:hypothetical protein